MMQKMTLIVMLAAALSLGACGLKGDLYIEEPVVEESATEAAPEAAPADDTVDAE